MHPQSLNYGAFPSRLSGPVPKHSKNNTVDSLQQRSELRDCSDSEGFGSKDIHYELLQNNESGSRNQQQDRRLAPSDLDRIFSHLNAGVAIFQCKMQRCLQNSLDRNQIFVDVQGAYSVEFSLQWSNRSFDNLFDLNDGDI